MAPDPPLDTRTRLIDAAVSLLWERGYAAAGVDDLCRHANARKGSFYHFFLSKSDLAVAALEAHWAAARRDVFEPISAGGQPGLERLSQLIDRTAAIQRRMLTETHMVLGCPFATLGQELAHRDERIRVAVLTIFDAHCHFLRGWLDEAQRDRQVPAGDNDLRARQLLALVEGALLLGKVAANPDVFVEICAGLPLLAGRGGGVVPRSSAIPELL